MKAALNGALNLSVLDGWWDEWFDGENGWAIPSADGVVDPDRRDDLEANALYELIENHVAPRFYDRKAGGVPTRWVEMVRHTLRTLGPKVLASRMVTDYTRMLYAPAAASGARMAADNFSAARALARWCAAVEDAWPGVTVLHVDSQLEGEHSQLGGRLTLRAEVALNGLSPDDVDVEAVYGTAGADDRLTDTAVAGLHPVPNGDGTHRFEGEIPLDRTGGYGYTVRVLPRSELLASAAELGLIASA
jgi:starch phosphorylase